MQNSKCKIVGLDNKKAPRGGVLIAKWECCAHNRLPSTAYRLPSTVYRLPSTAYRLPAAGAGHPRGNTRKTGKTRKTRMTGRTRKTGIPIYPVTPVIPVTPVTPVTPSPYCSRVSFLIPVPWEHHSFQFSVFNFQFQSQQVDCGGGGSFDIYGSHLAVLEEFGYGVCGGSHCHPDSAYGFLW